MNPQRIPPHSLDVERAVLGALILEGREAVPRVVDALKSSDFYSEAHRVIYGAITDLAARDEPVDATTLADELRRTERLQVAGGPAALALLMEEASIAANLAAYVERVRELGIRREAIQAGERLIAGAHHEETKVEAIVSELEQTAAAITERTATAADGTPDAPLSTLVDDLLLELATGMPEFVTYPLGRLNGLMGGGSRLNDLVYLAAGFGTGKTAVATDWAAHVAGQGQRVLIISAEMTKAAVTGRILGQRANIRAAAFRSGYLHPHEWTTIHAEAPRIARLPIVIDDQAQTLGAIRRLVRKHAPRLVIIDYLQLLQGPPSEAKRHEVNAISRGLKRMAKRAECVVLALSQITLVPDGKGWYQRPTAASLKESRGPSEDADTVILLWRPKQDEPVLELIVGKGRNHATGSFMVKFTPEYLQFSEQEREESE